MYWMRCEWYAIYRGKIDIAPEYCLPSEILRILFILQRKIRTKLAGSNLNSESTPKLTTKLTSTAWHCVKCSSVKCRIQPHFRAESVLYKSCVSLQSGNNKILGRGIHYFPFSLLTISHCFLIIVFLCDNE